jgi:hypothetical protein
VPLLQEAVRYGHGRGGVLHKPLRFQVEDLPFPKYRINQGEHLMARRLLEVKVIRHGRGCFTCLPDRRVCGDLAVGLKDANLRRDGIFDSSQWQQDVVKCG